MLVGIHIPLVLCSVIAVVGLVIVMVFRLELYFFFSLDNSCFGRVLS